MLARPAGPWVMWPGAAGPSPAGLSDRSRRPSTLGPGRSSLMPGSGSGGSPWVLRREEVELLGVHNVGEARGVVGPVVLPAGEPTKDVHLLAFPAVGHRCVHVVAHR